MPNVRCEGGASFEYHVEDIAQSRLITFDVDGIEAEWVREGETSDEAAQRKLNLICALEGCNDVMGSCWIRRNGKSGK
jgi:hypothetical protein